MGNADVSVADRRRGMRMTADRSLGVKAGSARRQTRTFKRTGLSTLDHPPQIVAEWLNELQDELGWHDRGRAYMLLRETLHATRDFLTVDEAVDLSAQLPLLIRGIFFEGWVPGNSPAKERSVDDFLARVMVPFANDPPLEPDVALAAVFSVLRRKVSLGEYDQVAKAMRKSLRELWM